MAKTRKALPVNRISHYYEPPLDDSGPSYPRESWVDVANDCDQPNVPLRDKLVFGAAVVGMVLLVVWLGGVH